MAEQWPSLGQPKTLLLSALADGDAVMLGPSRKTLRNRRYEAIVLFAIGFVLVAAGINFGWAGIVLGCVFGWLAHRARFGFLELTREYARFKGTFGSVVTIRRHGIVVIRVDPVGKSHWVIADLTPGGALSVSSESGVPRSRNLPLPLVAGHDPHEVAELLREWLDRDHEGGTT